MIVLTWIRKLYKILSNDASPSAIAFAVSFGLLAGLLPFDSGIFLAVIAFLLIFRVQLSTAIAFLLVGVVLRFAISPLALSVGQSLLEAESLKGFWTWACNAPGIAWFGLDRYYTVGALVVGSGLAAIVFFPIRYSVIAYRKYAHEKVSQNKFFKWLTNFWLIKGLKWVFVG